MEKAFSLKSYDVAISLNVDPDLGLTQSQASVCRNRYGPNALPEDEKESLWSLVLDQFRDKLTIILLFSAAISLALAFFEEDSISWNSLVDPFVILLILVLNAIVGVKQEKGAENAIAALAKYSQSDAKVFRNRQLITVKQSELVPGDIIELSTGDVVPADCRLHTIYSHSLLLDQSVLTGESESVSKIVEPIKEENPVLQDQHNMAFSGTTVTSGHAKAIVVLTGTKTAIGDIHKSIVSQISEPTPLKEKLDAFGDQLAKVITVICILVWLLNIPNFGNSVHHGTLNGAIYYFKTAIALAVAAIPEGLAVVITTALALGTKRMAKRNAIVRSLPSVETLGSTSVICSDKTGTLTTHQMCVSHVSYLGADGIESLQISGTDYSTEGEAVFSNGTSLVDLSTSLDMICQTSALCNGSSLTRDKVLKQLGYIGEPTEAALRVFVEKIGKQVKSVAVSNSVSPFNEYYVQKYKVLEEFEFSRGRKRMSVLVQQSNASNRLLVKGAPEMIIAQCTNVVHNNTREPFSSAKRDLVLDQLKVYGGKGLRVLAIAFRDDVSPGEIERAVDANDPDVFADIEKDLTLVGLVAMRDPPRPGVETSVAKCQNAGIKVIMVTGDSIETAMSIAQQVGILPSDGVDARQFVVTGKEFELLGSDVERQNVAKTARVFARVEPVHKQLLVQCLKNAGEVVAMTGDGVNDAPALRHSDIGIAMGSGTDVAKLASDMVLADDNFSTIETAVEEGRAIYTNTKQFIRYLISSNIGEVVSIFLTVLLGLPEALSPIQLLWVNLVTDGLPATALSFNPPDTGIMNRPPRPRDEPIVGLRLLIRYMLIGGYVGVATVGAYVWTFLYYSKGPGLTFDALWNYHRCESVGTLDCSVFAGQPADMGSTMSLSVLVVIEMFNAMNSLSEADSLLVFPIWKNIYLGLAILLSLFLHALILYIPSLQSIFGTVPLGLEEWKAVFCLSIPVIFVDEVLKVLERSKDKRVKALERKTQ